MQVVVQGNGFTIPERLNKHIEKRLMSSFKFTEQKVRKIIIRFFSETASRKQYIKGCRVQAIINGLPHIVTEHRDNNFYVAADTSIQRAHRSASKRLLKLRKNRRKIDHSILENNI